MTDPLAVLPLAIAAGGGRIDDHEAAALVTAGFALLQRCAPLVRALSGRRAAIVLPPGGALISALAAAEGHGALLVDSDRGVLPAGEEIGAVFSGATATPLFPLPGQAPVVLLDDVPRRAIVRTAGVERMVDLGTHFAIALEGSREATGLDEPAVAVPHGDHWRWRTHRELLDAARSEADRLGLTPMHQLSVASGWSDETLVRILATLLRGGHVRTRP